MTEHRFTNGITRCRRKGWGGTCWALLILLALTVFTAWLWCLVREAAVPSVCVPGLAVMPMPLAVMDGATAAFLTTVLVLPTFALAAFWAVGKIRAWDEEAAQQWSMLSENEGVLPEEDPLSLPCNGLDVAELRRILGSLVQQMQEARDLIKRAEGHLGVEDYGQDLAAAHLLMGVAIGCLAELLARTDPGLRSTPKGGTEV